MEYVKNTLLFFWKSDVFLVAASGDNKINNQ